MKAQDTQVPSKAQFGSGFRHKGRDEKTKNWWEHRLSGNSSQGGGRRGKKKSKRMIKIKIQKSSQLRDDTNNIIRDVTNFAKLLKVLNCLIFKT